MDLQTAVTLIAIATPVVMTAVAWGTFIARLTTLERRAEKFEDGLEVVHRRIDNAMSAPR